MAVINGDNGIKVLEGFNIFLSNVRKPIAPQQADGFIIFEINNAQGATPERREIQELFTVECFINAELFQIIDEGKLATLIARKVQEIISVNYFALLKIQVKAVAIASGYDNSFKRYDMEIKHG